MRDGTTPVFVPYPSGETLATGEGASLVQAFNQLFLFRGTDREVLVWEGDTGQPFRRVSDVPPTFGGADYTDTFPRAPWAVVVGQRMVAPYGRDQLAVSELLDFTRWDRPASARLLGSAILLAIVVAVAGAIAALILRGWPGRTDVARVGKHAAHRLL